MESSRPYLLQTRCKHNFLFVDASSISYISCVKPFDNFLFKLSCTLSEYPSLSVIHCPGRVLSASDLLTRQLNYVILERNDTNLSKEQAYILPNLNESIKPGELIPNNTLYQALNATPESEFYDVHEKHSRYTQQIAKVNNLFKI